MTFAPPGSPLKRSASACATPLQLGSARVEHLLVADCLGRPSVDLMLQGSDDIPKKPPVATFEP